MSIASILKIWGKLSGDSRFCLAGKGWEIRIGGIFSIANKTEDMFYWLSEVKSFNWTSLTLCNIGIQHGGKNKIGSMGRYVEEAGILVELFRMR